MPRILLRKCQLSYKPRGDPDSNGQLELQLQLNLVSSQSVDLKTPTAWHFAKLQTIVHQAGQSLWLLHLIQLSDLGTRDQFYKR